MKTLFKVLVTGILLTAFSALTFGQDKPDLATLFDKFKTEYKAPCGQRDAALVTGKQIIDLYGSDELNKDVIDVVKKRMAIINDTDPDCKRNTRYDAAYKAQNWADFFAVSKEIIAAKGDSPLSLDVMLTLVSVGFDRTVVDKVDTFNNDTMNYAKMSLQKIEAGKTSQTGKWGVFVPFNTKDNAQSWMNYIIGFLMYEKLGQKKDALTYFYKSTQIGTEKKGDFAIYARIGNYYFDEASRYDTLYRDARKANNNVENDDTRKLLGLARANADRGIDAFGRAYKFASADTKVPAATKTGLNKTLGDLYKFRFNLAPEAKTPDLDKYVADLNGKPMADPASEVTPVVIEEVKPATTPSNTTTPTTTPVTPTTKTTTTPTTTPTTKKPAMKDSTESTTMTPKTTTPAKKPVTKKKGTR